MRGAVRPRRREVDEREFERQAIAQAKRPVRCPYVERGIERAKRAELIELARPIAGPVFGDLDVMVASAISVESDERE